MNTAQTTDNNKKGNTVALAGMAVMILMTLTKIVPSSTIAGYSIFAGLAFFFITEAVTKTKGDASGLRFNTVIADLKKPRMILWVLLPCVSGIGMTLIGSLIFGSAYTEHLTGRVGDVLSLESIAATAVQVIVAAFGEEIAYRGFFFGKSSKMFPVWVCALVSSAVFAAGHIAAGNIGIVVCDIASVFIDSLLFSAVYYKSGNCVVSTVSHIIANALVLVAVILFF